MVRQDKSLLKIVHREDYRGFDISATFSRFGNLFVIVYNDYYEEVWTGGNVLEARNFVDETLAYYPEIRGGVVAGE